MNIGEVVKIIQKDYPSITISRIRFLEKEGLIKIPRTKGGTRKFNNKNIEDIKKILDLQEKQFYSLKAIKNNPNLLNINKVSKPVNIKNYSLHSMLKVAGISHKQFALLVEYEFEYEQENYTTNDIDRMKSWAYFFNLGLEPKNFSIIKSLAERTSDFLELINSVNNISDNNDSAKHFTNLIRSYSLNI